MPQAQKKAKISFFAHIIIVADFYEGGFIIFWLLIQTILERFFFFALHVSNSGSFPKPLSAKEESECLQKIKLGDIEAKNKLIEHNLRLVAHIIKKYYSSYKDQDDLISIGTIGLIKAVSTFDYTKGTRFATYAARCIENAILTYQNKKTPRCRIKSTPKALLLN